MTSRVKSFVPILSFPQKSSFVRKSVKNMSFFASIRRSLTTLRPKPLESHLERQIQDIRIQFQSLGEGRVDLETDDKSGLAIITFANEERKNSLSGKMMSQFSEVILALQHWQKGKAVLIRGENGFFCSGGDLNTVRKIADPENGRKMSLLMHSNCSRLQSLPLLSVALIEGMALGGGAEIATSCDFRVFKRSALFGFVHIKIGIVSAWGGGSRLSSILGPQKAMDLMLSGFTINGEKALEIGLCDHLIEDNENCLEATKEWLNSCYLDKPLECIKAVKEIINGQRYLPLELALEMELEESCRVWGAKEHLKGLSLNLKHI